MSGRGSRSHNRLGGAIAAAIVLGAPRLAGACSVCMSGREDENRTAFILTTVFLSVLPLAMIGGLGWYLRRRSRAIAESEGRATPSLGQAPLPR